jgi:XTP/dITP diphosphohydrolase
LKLYCATGNPGKLREFRLAADTWSVELDLLPDFRALPPAIEDGATFEENAIKKALHYAPYAGGPVFADDSGLEVDALSGAPGVLSARYAGAHGGDEANNRLLLENLRGVADRTARFVCAIALVENGRLAGTWRGAVEGRIVDAPRGQGGFGYDPVVYLPGLGKTVAELGLDEKNLVSHRGRACARMAAILADLESRP